MSFHSYCLFFLTMCYFCISFEVRPEPPPPMSIPLSALGLPVAWCLTVSLMFCKKNHLYYLLPNARETGDALKGKKKKHPCYSA